MEDGRVAAAASSLPAWIGHEVGAQIVRRLVERCASGGIPFLVVKGAITSRILYEDVAARPIVDVDIRVRPRDFAKFQRLARESGWRCVYASLTYRNVVYDFPPLTLDVECTVGAPGVCGLTVDAILARASPLGIGPALSVLVPELHDHAVLLTVNAFKDKLVTARPGAIADLERIVLHPLFRCDEFVSRIIDGRVVTLAWIVADWMESTRGSERWGTVRTTLEARAQPRRVYATLLRRLMAEATSAPLSLRLLARASADLWPMRATAVAGAVIWQAEMWLRDRTGMRGAA